MNLSSALILFVISYNVDIGLADDIDGSGSDEYDYGNDSENGTYYEPEWSGERCTREELAAAAGEDRTPGTCVTDCDCPDCAPFCSFRGKIILNYLHFMQTI